MFDKFQSLSLGQGQAPTAAKFVHIIYTVQSMYRGRLEIRLFNLHALFSTLEKKISKIKKKINGKISKKLI